MHTIIRTFLIFLIFFQCTNGYASGQQLYKNDAEMTGAAFQALSINEKIVRGSLETCSNYDTDFLINAKSAFALWDEKNQKYKSLLNGLREEIYDSAQMDGQTDLVKKYEESLTTNLVEPYVRELSKILQGLDQKARIESCSKIANAISKGRLAIADSAQLVAFLDKRLLEENTGNLFIEIEVPLGNNSEVLQSSLLTPVLNENLNAIALYDISTQKIEKDEKQINVFQIKFMKYFQKKEGLLMLDNLFDYLNKEIPETLVFRVTLKNGGSEKTQLRMATSK